MIGHNWTRHATYVNRSPTALPPWHCGMPIGPTHLHQQGFFSQFTHTKPPWNPIPATCLISYMWNVSLACWFHSKLIMAPAAPFLTSSKKSKPLWQVVQRHFLLFSYSHETFYIDTPLFLLTRHYFYWHDILCCCLWTRHFFISPLIILTKFCFVGTYMLLLLLFKPCRRIYYSWEIVKSRGLQLPPLLKMLMGRKGTYEYLRYFRYLYQIGYKTRQCLIFSHDIPLDGCLEIT